ncbi:MAG TPA: glycosyltransferase family 39 protein [Verrucomicrobiae bacterium]|nr:glycosyltransferase family 39 protein [Verrucomicrobiae bacterium]
MALIAIGIAAAIFGLLLVVVPSFFISFDEAKYIGIGYNLLDGLGPRTPFGGYFLSHAPVWSAFLVGPSALFGINPLDLGHVLDALAGIGLVVLAGALGWRIRPVVGGLAAAATIAITYLHDLTRTARLDVPAAFLVLAYLLVGFRAARDGRIRWAIATGALFALAFEVKEIALPLFPVPFLAAILWGRPWRAIAKTAGWTVLAAAIGLSWWFLLVARLSGTVYRLGTPAWTLLPISIVVLGLALAAIAGSHLDDRPSLVGLARRLRLGTGDDGRIGSGRVALVVTITVAWCATLLVVFARELGVRGSHVIDLPQVAHYVATWLPGVLKLAAAAGGIGVVMSIMAWRSARGGGRSAIGDLWLATICALPLVLLVVDVGEPPRNYLAQLGILAALAGAGWLWLVEQLTAGIARRQPSRPEERSPARATVLPATVVPIVLAVAVTGAGILLSAHALTFRALRGDQARADALTTTVAWVRANVPAGTKVAIGSFLSYEISLGLRGRNPTAQVRDVLAVGDPTAPQGIRVSRGGPQADWIAIDIAPRNVNEYQAYSASKLTADLRTSTAAYWIYATEAATSAPTIVPALTGAAGIREIAHWTWPTATIPIVVNIFALDPAELAFPSGHVVVSPEALERLVAELQASPSTGRATAATLVPELQVSPPSPTTAALLAQLRLVAGL